MMFTMTFFLLEIGASSPYVIEGKEYQIVEVIENDQIVPYDAIASGYVRYKERYKVFQIYIFKNVMLEMIIK